MTSIIPDIQSMLEKSEISNSQFFTDYVEFNSAYQELINKGVVSKRRSQLLTVSDKPTMPVMRFNLSVEAIKIN